MSPQVIPEVEEKEQKMKEHFLVGDATRSRAPFSRRPVAELDADRTPSLEKP